MLSFLEADDQAPEDAVVVIKQPRLENGHISYAIETLEEQFHPHGPVTLSSTYSGGRSRQYRCAE